MRKIILFTIFAVIFAVISGPVSLFAQRGTAARDVLEVRLASPLPRESPWGRTLDRIAAEWNRVTNGQVRLRVLHGGTEGSEERMHMALAGNTIQAAVFSSFGLSQINPAILTVSAPFLIRNDQELDAVMREIQTDLENGLNTANHFMLAWSRSGYVNLFSRDPVFTPDDLRRQPIASNAEAARMNTAFSTMGFRIVDTDWSNIGPQISTGAIMAVYNNPAAIAAFQVHRELRNMLSMNVAPVLGGIVINQVTWRRIGELNPRFQPELIRVTRQIATEFDSAMARTVNDAIQSMTRAGLRVNTPSPAQEQLWYNEVQRVTPTLLANGTFDRELYQRIEGILARHRQGR